ncbi:MAG TPA: hypothetical protein VND83_03515 [Acidimicrobiales bacterium]|nr:hypothetical protein [Acidimicrobiales bacterium]
MAAMDLSKLDSLDRIVAGASVVTHISLFLPWLGVSELGFSWSTNGFGAGFLGWFGAILIIAAGVYLVMLRSGSEMPKTSFGPGVTVLGLSVFGALLVVIKWVTLPRYSYSGSSFNEGARIGIYLTLLAGIVQVIISFRLFKRTGEAVPWAK